MKFSLANRNTACGHFFYQSEHGTDFGTVILDILSYYFWLPQLQHRAQMRKKTCTHILYAIFNGGCNFKLTLNDSIISAIDVEIQRSQERNLVFESADFVFDKPFPSSPLIDQGFDQGSLIQRYRSVDMYPCGFSENFFWYLSSKLS